MSTELKVVMFTDQVSSTLNMTRRTPAEVKQVAREQDDLTADAVKQCRGTILKDTGDGHLVEFTSCADAVRCGFLLQRRVKERNDSQADERLRFDLHVGIDFGEAVVLAGGDLRANTANLAARVCSACPAGEVYFTEKVSKELNPREARAERVEVEPDKLKGVQDKPDIYRLAEWLVPFESTPNPFIWRAGITNASDFFDRDAEQRTLRSYLRGRQNCQLVGPRRIGKTSLLRQVERAAPTWDAAAGVAYLDLQDPRCYTLKGWLALASRGCKWATPPATLAEFADCVDAALDGGQRPVLCLDEFEELTARRDEFTRDFFMTLRSCAQRGLSVVTASQRPLSELTDRGDPTSPFYNTFPLLRLGPFAPADASDFLNLYRAGVPRFSDDERRAILDFAKGHPLALQVACFHVLEAKEDGTTLLAALRQVADDMKAHIPVAW
ncbi:MAG TPA: adenylate/guanylate cyclase domain-containing protein [Pyrinomonadaceae bacterium]|nr:adenylate/guanylate cyclase domain-containing protein [Pyrinomonadaceae bacterium]